MDEFERNQGLKWLGFFYRTVTPGKFMMRMQIPNGILTSTQMRVLAEIIQRYCQGAGFQDQGNADITTRQNLQLRGIRIEDITDSINLLQQVGLTCIGMIGTKTRKDGQTVEAVDIWMGGKVGKDAHLGEEIMKKVPFERLRRGSSSSQRSHWVYLPDPSQFL